MSELSDAQRLAALGALGIEVMHVRRGHPLAAAPDAAAPSPAVARSEGAPGRPGAPGMAPPSGGAPHRVAERPAAPAPVSTAEPRRAAAAGDAVRAAPGAGGSRLERIAAMPLDELATFCESCRACKLGSTRHRAVFGAGNPRAPLMVIGEAPGAEEDRAGEPFVGAAGRLLDAMLRAIGLSRDAEDAARAVYIANVIKCRPPGNRNPEPDEIAQCEPLLRRQIELVRPRLVLALGRFAAQALTGSGAPIGRLRQQVHNYQGIPLVVSYHPAYLLRTPLDKAKAWADLCLVQDRLDAAAGRRPGSA